MRKSRFTEGQIVGILKELKASAKSTSICRQYGISESTLYNWRSKYGGLQVSDPVKLRQLEDENRRLRRIAVDQALNIESLKIVAEVNVYGLHSAKPRCRPYGNGSDPRNDRSADGWRSIASSCVTVSPEQLYQARLQAAAVKSQICCKFGSAWDGGYAAFVPSWVDVLSTTHSW